MAPLLGQRVVLGGLSSRPELNGQRGVARSFEGGRYAVALEGGGESVRVRPGNLSPVAAERASSGGVRVSDEVIVAAERGEEPRSRFAALCGTVCSKLCGKSRGSSTSRGRHPWQ